MGLQFSTKDHNKHLDNVSGALLEKEGECLAPTLV